MPGTALRADPRANFAIALALLVLAGAAVTSRARAQVDPADGAVAVHLSGPDDPELRDAIRELLARLHLQIADAGGDGADGGTAVAPRVAQVEVDLSSPTDAVVVVRSDAGEVLFRRAVPRDTSASIVREEIAHEVQSAVESALLAARERATRPEPAAPAPPPVALPPAVEPAPAPAVVKERPTTTASSSFSLEMTTLAGVGPIASDSGPVARIGLGVDVIAQKLPLRPSVGLAALYALPFDTAQIAPTDLSTRTSIASVRVLPALELLRLKWLAAEIGVGAGLDVMTVAPQQNPSEQGYYVPSNALRTATTRIDPIFSAMATFRVAVVPGVVFLLTGGIDVDPESRDYVLRGSTVTDVLAPSHVRPMVLAGFGFAALGDGRFVSGGAR